MSKGGTPAAPAPHAESPRSQPSFEAERAQLAEDVYILTAEKAKQQVSGIAWASLHASCNPFAASSPPTVSLTNATEEAEAAC